MNIQIFDMTFYTIDKLQRINEREQGFADAIARLARDADRAARDLRYVAERADRRFAPEQSDYERALLGYVQKLHRNADEYREFIAEYARQFDQSVAQHRQLLREARRDMRQYQKLLAKYKNTDIRLNRRLSVLDYRILTLAAERETCCNRKPVEYQIDALNAKRLKLRKQIGYNLQMLDSLRQRASEVISARTQDLTMVQYGQTELYFRFFNAIQENSKQEVKMTSEQKPPEVKRENIAVAATTA